MQNTNVMRGHGCCDGDCTGCDCQDCGGAELARLIQRRNKKAYRRYQRRQDRSLLRQVHAMYNWRLI